MVDIIRLRNNSDAIKKLLENRGERFDTAIIDEVVSLDAERRDILVAAEKCKSEKNQLSLKIRDLKKAGLDAEDIINQIKVINNRIDEYDKRLSDIEKELSEKLLLIPNIPNANVPEGDSDEDNVEVRKWGNPREFSFKAKEHWTIGTDNGFLDFERAGKVTGSRFVYYKGFGARLERALINYFLDKHTCDNGYTEIFPPYMVNRDSMVGTGQLPKFEDDVYKIADSDMFMIPTAEVPITNIYRDEILDEDILPLKFVAYSACFRAESGSKGRDTRGLIRQHQFNKVELVKICRQEDSYEQLECLVNDAEVLLKELKLPYRIVRVCKGELGFTAALKYDIEVWMPSYNKYVEISSCSCFEDFQGRRANIRYKSRDSKKVRFVHTVNGSGLAVGRTVAAILENYQNEDGTVTVPDILRSYMGM